MPNWMSASIEAALLFCFGLRVGDIDKPDRRQPLARDGQVEDIEAIVISDHVVELLRLDALRNVDVLIEQAFLLAQRVADDLARRSDDHRDRLRALFERLARLLADPLESIERRFVEKRRRDDVEHLALE